MSLPRVYAAINAITAAFANRGVAKERINLDDGYAYRGIDEVVERLAPLLGEHKLCILPRVLKRTQAERIDPTGESLIHVTLRVAFDLVSVEDGSSHTIEAIGEALDHSDKASAKALTSAYKHAVLHAFCIPVSGREDPERSSPGRGSHVHSNASALLAPVEGWAQWAADIASVVASCATPEAIDRLLASNRVQLSGLAREQPGEYARVGRAIAARRKVLAQPVVMAGSVVAQPVVPQPVAAVRGSVASVASVASVGSASTARRAGSAPSVAADVDPQSGPSKPRSAVSQSGAARRTGPRGAAAQEARRAAKPMPPVNKPRPPKPTRVSSPPAQAVDAGVLKLG